MPDQDQPDRGRPGQSRPGQSPSDHSRPDRDQPGQAASVPVSGAAPQGGTAPQGLSWSWELDFETLVAALNEPAPWNRPPRRPSVGGMVTCTSAPGSAAPGSSSSGSSASGTSAPGSAASHTAAPGSAASHTAAPGSTASHTAALGGAAAEGAAAEGAPATAAGAAAVGDGGGAAEPVDQDAVLDGLLAAEVREIPLTVAAGRVAECLPAGPGLAGWLAAADPAGLEDGALAGVAASWRRLASWAQAGELAAVAQIASRSAARDPKVTVDGGGRPARVPDDAAAEVSLGLVMSRCNAEWWLDLAITLRWRLAATGAALAAGTIDLPRARLIAEATALLAEQDARTVEDQILPRAGELTSAGLRAALRRAVIAVDPDGAERRRQQSEARAKVCLYPDEDGTAALAGYQLPGIGAAAAMARISALARALKASGAGGGIDLLRAQVFLGLLCGTLPLIPPADGAPPDNPPPPSDTPPPSDSTPPSDTRPRPPGGTPPPGGAPADSPGPRPGRGPRPRPAQEPGHGHGDPPAEDIPPPDGPPEDLPPDGPGPGPCPGPGYDPGDDWPGDWRAGQGPLPHWPPLPDHLPAPAAPDNNGRPPPGPAGPAGRGGSAGQGRPRRGGRPPPGLLDLTLPWTTLAGLTSQPGHLGRLGPITPAQACQLAAHAATRPGTDWRIILTTPAGHALAITRIPRTRTRTAPARENPAREDPAREDPARAGTSAEHHRPTAGHDRPGRQPATPPAAPRTGLVGRVTLTIPQHILDTTPAPDPASTGILGRALAAAATAATQHTAQAAADTAAGGCAHTTATPSYRPPPRLHEYITARDLTCRQPTCRQPAWHTDLDHTRPYAQGGPTCRCNLGGFCRHDHILKHAPGWHVTQPAPGTFHWTTPTGRTYLTTPDTHTI